MRGDNAPVGKTCPIIDKVISFIQSIDYEGMNMSDYSNALDRMEEIRSANGALRDWGNEEYKRAEELESELDNVKSELEDALNEIKELNSQIKELETELNTVQ